MARTFCAPRDVGSPGEGAGVLAGWTAHTRGLASPHHHLSEPGVGSGCPVHRCMGSCLSCLATLSSPQGSLESAQFLAGFQASFIFAAQ